MSGYNPRYDLLFIHVPKTGGTSMERTEIISGRGHEPYWALSDELRSKAGFSLGFVRNPYDRFVSMVTEGMYRTLREAGQLPDTDAGRKQLAIRARDLVTYASQQGDQPEPLEFGASQQWRVLGQGDDPLPHIEGWSGPVHYLPQVCFLSAPGMTGIGVDMVGRFENMAADWRRVCERVGANCELPHVRNSVADRGSRYADFYTPESMAIVRRLYAHDFETFGYDPDDLTPTSG